MLTPSGLIWGLIALAAVIVVTAACVITVVGRRVRAAVADALPLIDAAATRHAERVSGEVAARAVETRIDIAALSESVAALTESVTAIAAAAPPKAAPRRRRDKVLAPPADTAGPLTAVPDGDAKDGGKSPAAKSRAPRAATRRTGG